MATGKKFQFSGLVPVRRRHHVTAVLWTLHLDGPFEDSSGKATVNLHRALEARGVVMPQTTLADILKTLDDGAYGQFINRRVVGKRTYRIELTADPAVDPFPPNPFGGNKAKFRSATAKPAPAPELEAEPAELPGVTGETFARQSLLEEPTKVPTKAAEPVPAPVPEPAHTYQVPEQVKAATNGSEPPAAEDEAVGFQTVANLLTTAISLISQAVTLSHLEGAERHQLDMGAVDRRIDERMAAYVAMAERISKLEANLRDSHRREAELIQMVRTQQGVIESVEAGGAAT